MKTGENEVETQSDELITNACSQGGVFCKMNAPPKNREAEAAKAHRRAAIRFGTNPKRSSAH